MNKAYFKESLRSGFKTCLFILIIGIIIYPLVVLTYDFYDQQEFNYKTSSQVGLAITYLAILCYIIPIFKLSFLQKKKQIDYYYSLPIKRTNLISINILIGFIQIIIPYTIIYFLGMGLTMMKTDIYHYIWYLPLYAISIYVALGVYLFNCFIFTRGNTISDGIILLILYTFVGTIFLECLNVLESIKIDNSELLITFEPFINIGNFYNQYILYYGESRLTGYYVSNFSYFNFFYPIILGIIGTICLFFCTKCDKAERAEQITDSYFGYRIITPIYFVLLFLLVAIEGTSIIYAFLLIILYLIGEVIHYRKVKLSKKTYFVMSCVVLGTIFLTIFINLLNL